MANPFVRVGGFFGRFFGNTIGESAAYGIGGALREPLHPLLQELTNETWKVSTAAGISKPLGPGDAADIVAEDVELQPWGAEQAGMAGYTADTFAAVLGATLNAPGIPQLFEAWRRDLIDDAAFTHGLRKAKLEPRWDEPLKQLKSRLLSLADLANARQQGFVDEARQHEESRLQGLDADRADILFHLVGLPPGASEAQSLLNRGLIDDATFAQIIREGHTKTKYTDVLRRAAVYVLSPINYVEGRLRGWLTDSEMYAGTALHGVTKADTDLLFKIHGRPISFHQTFIGTRRGGTLDGPIGDIDPAFLASLRRSNIQPPFYNLAWAQRYTYPSAFVLRALTQTGDITRADAERVLLYEGWEPGFATKVSTAWATPDAAGTSATVKSEQTRLRTATHKSYVARESDDAAATTALQAAGVPAADIAAILTVWNAERDLIRAQLSPSDIRKAYQQGDVNAATGAVWTREDAFTALLDRGWRADDANSYLDIPYKG